MNNPIRIVLADDHSMVRQGLKQGLEGQPDLRVVGETGSGREVAALVAQLRPDVLLLDVRLADLSGLEVARQVCPKSPGTHVIMVSMYEDEAYVLSALRAGASGYVVKRAPLAELVQAVRQVVDGHLYLSPSLSDRLIRSLVGFQEEATLDPLHKLTAREREVLSLVASGTTNKEIAGILSISLRTVERHRANIKRKLGLGSQAALLRFAVEHDLLGAD